MLLVGGCGDRFEVATFELEDQRERSIIEQLARENSLQSKKLTWKITENGRHQLLTDQPQAETNLKQFAVSLDASMQGAIMLNDLLLESVSVQIDSPKQDESDENPAENVAENADTAVEDVTNTNPIYPLDIHWSQGEMEVYYKHDQSYYSNHMSSSTYFCAYKVPITTELPELSYKSQLVVGDNTPKMGGDNPLLELLAEMNANAPTEYRDYSVITEPPEAAELFNGLQLEYEGERGLFWVNDETKSETNYPGAYNMGNSHIFAWCEAAVASKMPQWLRQITGEDVVLNTLKAYEINYEQLPIE